MNKKRILIIDNETTVRNFLSELLTREGYDVVSTGNGYEALEKIKTQKFHLILVDINMPWIEKLPIYARIRDLIRENLVPIIIMSGSGIEPSLTRALKKEMYDYIPKPLEIDLIREKVKRCLKIHES